MIEDLKKEMQSFINDTKSNIKNEEDLKFIQERTEKLFDAVLNSIENIIDFRQEELNRILERQYIAEKKLEAVQEKVDAICEDIYEEEEEDFTIVCPYCNNEFDVDIDEDLEEIKCPECENTIELDWDGNPNDDDNGCSGGCSHCGGCK